jgi:hypothetical protein
LEGPSLNGYNLEPGVYSIASGATLSGVLTLNGTQSPGNNQWYFQLSSTLTTYEGSEVVQVGLGTPCDVFWLVLSAASFGNPSSLFTPSTFIGNVLANSIDANNGAQFFGGLYASQDIILQSATVVENCPTQSTSSSSSSSSSMATTSSSSSSSLPTSSSFSSSLPTSSSFSSSLPTSSSFSSSLPTSSSLSSSLPTSSSQVCLIIFMVVKLLKDSRSA